MNPAWRNCWTTLKGQHTPSDCVHDRSVISGQKTEIKHMCSASKATDATDLFAVRLAVAPYRDNHDLSRGQPQGPGPSTEQMMSSSANETNVCQRWSHLTICLQSFQPGWRSSAPGIPAPLCGSSRAGATVRPGWN